MELYIINLYIPFDPWKLETSFLEMSLMKGQGSAVNIYKSVNDVNRSDSALVNKLQENLQQKYAQICDFCV